ncbi:hypothetical protein B0H14DRAFT_3165870 [Mycena olivaceomarginata]|nr:hypothetical protein B0H14DRAFT_3165870 [Mycena olivaceomarginata]
MNSPTLPVLPAHLPTPESLIAFLHSKNIPALATDIYGADFRLGTFGSYVPDETACVRPDGPTYVIYVFGCVCKPITWPDGHRTFRIDGGPDTNSEAFTEFKSQIKPLALMVKEADDDDYDVNDNTAMRWWRYNPSC